jgi:hypothetical protein
MDQPSGKGVGNLQRILVTAGSKRATLRKLGKPLAAMVFGSLLSISQAAHAQNKYDFITIDVTGEEVTRTAANGNSTHEIVGEFDDKDGTHGFVLNKGVFTTIDFPNASVTLLNGINASGQLMGTYVDSTGKLFAFVGNKGDFTKLDPSALRSDLKAASSTHKAKRWARIGMLAKNVTALSGGRANSPLQSTCQATTNC